MGWLKSLVAVLTGMIVIAVAMLGYGFYKRTTDPDWRLFGAAQPPSQAPVLAPAPVAIAPDGAKPAVPEHPPYDRGHTKLIKPWGEASLGLAPDCRVTTMEPTRRWLYLTIGPDGSCARIIIFDIEHGRVLGTIRTGR